MRRERAGGDDARRGRGDLAKGEAALTTSAHTWRPRRPGCHAHAPQSPKRICMHAQTHARTGRSRAPIGHAYPGMSPLPRLPPLEQRSASLIAHVDGDRDYNGGGV
ncbi:unnamed protein product [Taenia asiatica]|uniref:Uncharacterized protein n=1 Tax=Taenia asiatica TaxID=60517 RepID=A0A0R3W300_TAEAS|nr:unnamed protein product [Taenia asiatica]